MPRTNYLASKCALAAGAALIALSLAACSIGPLTIPNPFAGTSVEQAIKNGERTPAIASPVIAMDTVLTIGITPTNQPYTYIDSEGNYNGLDVDYAAAIAEELGLKASFVQVANADDAVAKNVDIYLPVDAVSAPQMLLVGTYEESASGLFRKGAGGVVSAADLSGTTIGVQANSNSAAVLQKTIIDASSREFATINEAFAALDMGTVNYVLCDAGMGAYVARAYDGISFCGTLGEATPRGVAVSNANIELQNQIKTVADRLAAGGRTALLRSRWMGDLPTLSDDTRVMGVQVGTNSNIATTDAAADTTLTTGSNAVTLSDAQSSSSSNNADESEDYGEYDEY